MSIAEKLTTIAENEQKVYEAGKTAEWNEFWDKYQSNGNRTDYNMGFAQKGWSVETFRPKYDIDAREGWAMFMNFTSAIDLPKHLEELGVSLNVLDMNVDTQVFAGSQFTRLGVIGKNKTSSFGQYIRSCSNLHTVDKFVTIETSTYNQTFENLYKLENITFEGVIGNNINFKWSPLSVESMNSVISCLKDYSGTGTTHTVTFKADRETMLTDSEKAVATDKGWTLAWN